MLMLFTSSIRDTHVKQIAPISLEVLVLLGGCPVSSVHKITSVEREEGILLTSWFQRNTKLQTKSLKIAEEGRNNFFDC